MKTLYNLISPTYLILATFLLLGFNSHAQCDGKKIKVSMTPIVGVSDGYPEGENHIDIAGYSVTNEVKIKFPISYELRKDRETGAIISQGTFTRNADFNNLKSTSQKTSNNLHSGNYYLISCDSSLPQNYSVQSYTIQKNKKTTSVNK